MAKILEGYGGIVLCGGRSTRMGQDKAWMPFGPELMLQRVVRILSEIVQPIVVVAGQSQSLPELPPAVLIVRDRWPDRGPLEGIRRGMEALPSGVEAAYVTACDTPLLRPDFVRRVMDLLGDHDAAAPWIDGVYYPLAALFRRHLLPTIDELLSFEGNGPRRLLESIDTRRIEADELSDVDPDLEALFNLNEPADYSHALQRAGL
jgi:molybdopterin-guanine dinucleotide biosynthesis protein A